MNSQNVVRFGNDICMMGKKTSIGEVDKSEIPTDCDEIGRVKCSPEDGQES